jgi:magnesium-transporting ATPase (P-type)
MSTLFSQASMPANYSQILKEYTSNGFRVLAIGSKRIEGVDYKSLTR